MIDKFKNVPLDDETTILAEHVYEIAGYDALFQIWKWDGIVAQSIIFADADASEMSDSEIEEQIRSLNFIKKPETSLSINRSVKGFTFVNFTESPFGDDFD